MSAARLFHLLQRGGQQFGTFQDLEKKFATAGQPTPATQLIVFTGDPEDILPFRIYLSAWTPASDATFGTLPAGGYCIPYPWAGIDTTKTTPALFDAYTAIALFARIRWGAGGTNNEAFVDWPRGGQLVQVSGSKVYVDAVAVSGEPNVIIPAGFKAPTVSASLGIEPGGGDSAACATFTYRRQARRVVGPPVTWLFQIPPFARTWQLLANRPALRAAGATVTMAEISAGGSVEAVWEDLMTVDTDQSLAQYPCTRAGRDLLVTLTGATGNAATDNLGIIFSLDL